MAKKSAGILLYRRKAGTLEVFLVHPGGPFWANRDEGAWSIPKGEFDEEEPLAAARREFEEETGFSISGNFTALKPVRQKGGKTVYAFAVEGNCDAGAIRSNTFEMEWPRGSGKLAAFAEADRAQWFDWSTAKLKLNQAQANLIDQLQALLA